PVQFAVQPQTFGVPPPPQVCGAVQVPQLMSPPQPSGAVPQFCPAGQVVFGMHAPHVPLLQTQPSPPRTADVWPLKSQAFAHPPVAAVQLLFFFTHLTLLGSQDLSVNVPQLIGPPHIQSPTCPAWPVQAVEALLTQMPL